MSTESKSPVASANKMPSWADLRGSVGALVAPLFLGFAPVLGKVAYNGGSDPFTVAALRTVIAAAILWIVYLLFARRFTRIYTAGLIGCVVVGTVNGIGSLFYYNGLTYLDASVAQLLNATYLIFVVILTRLGGQRIGRRIVFRTIIAVVAIVFLTGGIKGQISWLGAGLMIGNAICFAGTYILSQRVLDEMPAPTVTLYVMTTMAIVVVMARFMYRLEWVPQSSEAFGAIIVLGLTTALSRLALFMGIKLFGSLQTVFLAVFETIAALAFAAILLKETLTPTQWFGASLLLVSLLLVRADDFRRDWLNHVPIFDFAGMSFQKVAFIQAFGKDPNAKLSTTEFEAVRRMMLPAVSDAPSRPLWPPPAPSKRSDQLPPT